MHFTAGEMDKVKGGMMAACPAQSPPDPTGACAAPCSPSNASDGFTTQLHHRTYCQHQLLEVTGELSPDAPLDWLPRNLQVLIKDCVMRVECWMLSPFGATRSGTAPL